MDRETARDSINSRPITDFITVNYDRNRKPCCPICGSGTGHNHTSALSIKQIGGKYRVQCFANDCFSNKGEDTLGALKIIWNCSESEVIEKCGYGKDSTLPPVKIQPVPKETPTDYGEYLKECNKNIENAKDYLLSRGISVETAKTCYLGYDAEWKHPKVDNAPLSPRLIIPTSKYGYTARDTRTNLTDKQQQYQKQKTGTSQMFKYAIRPGKPLFCVEGELDAISIYECGGSAIGLGSINKRDKLIEYLEKEKIAPIILALDNDERGQETQKYIGEELSKRDIDFIDAHYFPGIKDANDLLVRSREEMTDFIKGYEEQAINKANEEIMELQQNVETENIQNYRELFERKVTEERNAPKIRTELWDLNNLINGGFKKGIYILGGISGTGKTTLLTRIADDVAKNGVPVVFFSMEQDRQQIISKSLSRLTRTIAKDDARAEGKNEEDYINKYAQTADSIIDESYKEFFKANEYVERAKEFYFNNIAQNLWIYDGRSNAEFIDHKIKNIVDAYGMKPLVIVDYLHKIVLKNGNRNATEIQEVNEKLSVLGDIRDRYDVPMIVVSSLNRDTYKSNSNSKPSLINLASFRGSGQIEYDADCVLALDFKKLYDITNNLTTDEYNEEKEKKAKPMKLVLRVIKGRLFGTGNYINLTYHSRFNEFEDSPCEDYGTEEVIHI